MRALPYGPVESSIPPTRWSDPATWPDGVVPAAGASVVIPLGHTVVLDVSPPELKRLTVEGTLVVLDSADVRLTSGAVLVGEGGRLEAGSEARPFAHRLTITLAGGGEGAAAFKDFTAYKHPGRAVWLRGVDHRMAGAVLADNGTGATFASVERYLDDALVVGESGNNRNPLGGPNPTRGFQFYDGRVAARRSTFVNFRPEGGLATAALSSNPANSFALSTANYAEGLRFVNAAPVYVDAPVPGKDGDRAAVFRDADGSVTGEAGAYVVADAPVLVTAGCAARAG